MCIQKVVEEIFSQDAQLSELSDRVTKLVAKHRQKVSEKLGVSIGMFQATGTLEEKSVKAEVLKDVCQNVLYTLGQLATEFPEVGDILAAKVLEANMKMPAKPPSRGGGGGAGNTGRNRQQQGGTTTGGTVPQRSFDLEL